MSINDLRDHIAWKTCNFILNHVATERYRRMIAGSIRLGIAAALDEKTFSEIMNRKDENG